MLYATGSGPGVGTSRKTINDGNWHTIEIKREKSKKLVTGSLTIDNGEPVEITWPDGATSLNFALPIYVGGMDTSDDRYTYMSEKIGEAAAASLVGCINNIQYRNKTDNTWTSYGSKDKDVSTQGCFENQEDGAFIQAGGGSLALGMFNRCDSFGGCARMGFKTVSDSSHGCNE